MLTEEIGIQLLRCYENIFLVTAFDIFNFAEKILEQVECTAEDRHYGDFVFYPGVCCLLQFF